MNIILFGFKCCGKTTLGQKLAQRMNRPFIDLDELICARYQELTGFALTCREIGEKLGEAAFRELEKHVLLSLGNPENQIIALGGGTVIDPEHQEYLKGLGTLVYLEASPDTLKKRVMLQGLPAFLQDTTFEELYQARKPVYESIAAKKFNVDESEEKDIVTALCSLILIEEHHREVKPG